MNAIFAPTFYSKRGVLTKGDFRYLEPYAQGEIDYVISIMTRLLKKFQQTASIDFAGHPELADLQNASDNRSYIHWLNHSQFNPHWSADVDYSHISDDYYFNDFGNVAQLISTNQLLQQARLTIQVTIGILQAYYKTFKHYIKSIVLLSAIFMHVCLIRFK